MVFLSAGLLVFVVGAILVKKTEANDKEAPFIIVMMIGALLVGSPFLIDALGNSKEDLNVAPTTCIVESIEVETTAN